MEDFKQQLSCWTDINTDAEFKKELNDCKNEKNRIINNNKHNLKNQNTIQINNNTTSKGNNELSNTDTQKITFDSNGIPTYAKDVYENKVYSNGEYFVNPYNFVSLGEKAYKKEFHKSDELKKDENSKVELLTGVISCVMKAKTPVFIPNTTNDNAFGLAEIESTKKENNKNAKDEHKNYEFFSYNDLSGKNSLNEPKEPIIPGSSIRGVIRSAYEALTDSCMMTYDEPVTSRENKPKNAGILECDTNGTWKLYEAEKFMLKTGKCDKDIGKEYPIYEDKNNRKYIALDEDDKNEKSLYTGDEIMFDEGNIYGYKMPKLAQNIGNGNSTGILLLGEPFGKKHHDSIFTYNSVPKKEVEGDLTRAIEGLLEVLRVYKDPAINRNMNKGHNGYRHYDLNGKKVYPVWYRKDDVGEKIYLSPACISRIAYYYTIPDILQKHGGYDACKSNDIVCQACELFGMAGENSALGSKIRFSDAELTVDCKNKNKYYDKNPVTLDELSSPKPSAVEFYTKQPDEKMGMWDYDSNNGGIEILGRKFYWHSEKYEKYYKNKMPRTNRNITIRPVTKDTEFEFKIYYERITSKELKELIWVLTIGENELEGKQCHKIGGAKPLGFGSIKIVVNEVKGRRILVKNGAIRRESEILDKASVNTFVKETPFTGTAYNEFIKITDFESMKNEYVNYPFGKIIDKKGNVIGTNDEGGHVWFGLNRTAGDKATGISKSIKFTLKEILDDHNLPKLEQPKKEKNKRGTRK